MTISASIARTALIRRGTCLNQTQTASRGQQRICMHLPLAVLREGVPPQELLIRCFERNVGCRGLRRRESGGQRSRPVPTSAAAFLDQLDKRLHGLAGALRLQKATGRRCRLRKDRPPTLQMIEPVGSQSTWHTSKHTLENNSNLQTGVLKSGRYCGHSFFGLFASKRSISTQWERLGGGASAHADLHEYTVNKELLQLLCASRCMSPSDPSHSCRFDGHRRAHACTTSTHDGQA